MHIASSLVPACMLAVFAAGAVQYIDTPVRPEPASLYERAKILRAVSERNHANDRVRLDIAQGGE